MPHLTRRGMLLFCGTGLLAAKQPWKSKDSDFWNTKEPSQWSNDEIDKLITKSPWSKQVKGSAPLPSEDAGWTPSIPGVSGSPGGAGRTNGGSTIPGIGIPGLGGGGRGGQNRGSGQTQFELIVRWESAKPVLQAIRSPLAEMFDKHYVISVNGIPNAQANTTSEPTAFLEGKGSHPIKSAEFQQSPGSFTKSFLFGFPNDANPLSLDDREITFTTRIAKSPITVKFNLAEMLYHGVLAL